MKQCRPVIQNVVRRWIDKKKRKKLPRIHAVNIRNSPDIGEMAIESKEQSTQTELAADARGKFVSGAKVLAAVPSISQPRRVYEDRLEAGRAEKELSTNNQTQSFGRVVF